LTSAATKPRPRTKTPKERRDELTQAAFRLFLEQGVAPTTIEQITVRADVAKGTFYLYFTSKEDVLEALRDRFEEELLTRVQKAVATKAVEDWTGKLVAWAQAGVTGYFDLKQLHDVVFLESRPAGVEGLIDNELIDHLTALLQAGADAGAWSLDDARFTAVFLFNGFHGAADAACATEKRVNRSRLTNRLERLCLRAVGLDVKVQQGIQAILLENPEQSQR
jgi:AcrR family transcriptional regulator